ncbi:MAG: site-2 protease family protein, partial [bacterium]|nr:site-2 protease family protein [bacterium]
MFSTLTSILIAIFVLGMIIFFHELGHFLTAKAAGLTVHEFAIGMGPVIVSVFHKGTKYSLRLLPIGGLARLAGEEPDDQNEQVPIHGRFDKRSVATRMGVIVAGPIMNFVLASLIFVFLFVFIGVPTNKPIIGTVSEGGAAQMAGLMANDQLLRIDQIQIAAWTDIQRAIADKADQEVSILLQRGGQLITIVAVPRFSAENNRALIGITPR